MLITLLEIAFDLTYVIISKTASGLYHGGKYLLSNNKSKTDKIDSDTFDQAQIDLLLLQEIQILKESNQFLKTELESMKIKVDELNSKVKGD